MLLSDMLCLPGLNLIFFMIPVEIGVPDQDFQWSNTRAPFRNNKLIGYYSI